jgi:hypothetical protein
MSGGKRKTRKNDMVMEGGKRKTRKNVMMGGKRKASPWNKFVKKIFSEMRRKDKDASFGDALKEASKRKSEM